MKNKKLEKVLDETKPNESKEIQEEVAVIQPKPVMLFGYTEEQWSKLSREERDKAIFKALL